MSNGMSTLRKEDLSLYLYIKDVILRPFQEVEEYASLRLLPDMCSTDSYVYELITDLEPHPAERGRGWVYFDSPSGDLPCEPYPTVSGLNGDGDPAFGTPEQNNKVVLYETTSSGLQEVDWTEYMIDYVDCRIITENLLETPVVSFFWNYVSVVDEWSVIEAANTPVVVVDMNSTNKDGYQLGGGRKTTRRVNLHVFASNPAERNDIVETLYDGLYNKSCPVHEFVTGSVLDYDGTFYGRKGLLDRDPNPINKLTFLFDRDKVSNVSQLYFDDVTSRHVNLPLVMSTGREHTVLSDLNAYRSKISFKVISYDDRIIPL